MVDRLIIQEIMGQSGVGVQGEKKIGDLTWLQTEIPIDAKELVVLPTFLIACSHGLPSTVISKCWKVELLKLYQLIVKKNYEGVLNLRYHKATAMITMTTAATAP